MNAREAAAASLFGPPSGGVWSEADQAWIVEGRPLPEFPEGLVLNFWHDKEWELIDDAD